MEDKDRKPPRAAVIILNWRRPDDTLACLSSVLALDWPAFDVMLCDNDSGDGSWERLKADVPERMARANAVRAADGRSTFALEMMDAPRSNATAPIGEGGRLCLIQTGRNGGYAFGNNVGTREALGDPRIAYIWVLNNDTEVEPAALSQVISHMEGNPAVALCGMTVLYRGQRNEVQALGGGRFLPTRARCIQVGEGLAADAVVDAGAIEASLSYVNGAAVVARRDFIDQVGLMDEGYFLYWEEMDWATRARKARWRLGFCPGAVAYHAVGASTGSNDHGLPTPAATYWLTRSKFRYLRLHRPALLAIAAPLVLKSVLVEMMHGRRARAKAMLRGAAGLSQG